MNKIKQYAVIGVFFLFICGFSLVHFLLPDKDFSPSERKPLAQAPTLTWNNIRTGDYFAEAESYLLDQFPMRPQFLNAKRILDKNIFLMSSSSGYANAGDHLTKITPTLYEDQIEYAVKLLNRVLEGHPEIASAYCAVVPDKNYFLSQVTGQPSLDYNKIFEMTQSVNAEQIPLTQLLSLDDFYRTDSHWRQERILPIAEAICNSMGVPAADPNSYYATTLEGFKGLYYELTESPPDPDTLTYLRNEAIDNAIVKRLNNYGQMEEMPMYSEENLYNERKDGYDFFLGGPESLITIENPNAQTDRHLILIRDSFGSSLAPLLTDSYAKITILDFRYLKTVALNMVDVDFQDADVLILYSTGLFNEARSAGLA